MPKCKGTTKSGNACKRNAVKGQDLCTTHASASPAPEKTKAPAKATAKKPAGKVKPLKVIMNTLENCVDDLKVLSVDLAANGKPNRRAHAASKRISQILRTLRRA